MSKNTMRIAMLSPIAWRTPPRHYGPWERVVSWLAEGLLLRQFDRERPQSKPGRGSCYCLAAFSLAHV